MRRAPAATPVRVDAALLRRWPLPMPGPDGDKEARGRVLIIAGSREMPGAAILAAHAALRAGAGKLCVATAASVAGAVGCAVPEARVIALRESAAGGVDPAEARRVAEDFDAALIGPGMLDERAVHAFARAFLLRAGAAPVVLDATAMGLVCDGALPAGAQVVLTPHAGELAHLGIGDKESVLADGAGSARAAAARFGAHVAFKAAVTHIAEPGGKVWRHRGGNVGLGVSGSGDVLAGLIAGLTARGADLAQAAVWGVALHARAGEALARRRGPLGYLASELAAEVPRLLAALARRRTA
ncbi:MAG TPA: NAD(P)H-hydrate dehydratase [Candidatus Binatia bacterium]|nr:NAD(P)H-hydrate dehydratase [Candidatus Binatia bacterium]